MQRKKRLFRVIVFILLFMPACSELTQTHRVVYMPSVSVEETNAKNMLKDITESMTDDRQTSAETDSAQTKQVQTEGCDETDTEDYKKNVTDNADQKATVLQNKICVYVCGKVQNEGVYYLEENARMYQAIEAAGGFLDTAATTSLNLADYVTDGQMIYVPSFDEITPEQNAVSLIKSEEEQMVSSNGTISADILEDARISLNTATKEQLMMLPGIGETKAAAILSYREMHGNFSSPEEIMLVPGIKEAVYNSLKDKIRVP